MKKTKLINNLSASLLLVMIMFFNSIPRIHAQTDQDWSDPVNLSFSGSAINPILVKDYQGVLHVIWVDKVDDTGNYKYSQSVDGMTWTSPVYVKFPFGPRDSTPFLLADANGSIHIFWIANDGSLFYGQATTLDIINPSKWKTTGRLARDILSFNVTLDYRGALHIAYIRSGSSELNPAGVYYRQSIIGGGFWSDSTLLYASEYFRATKQDDAYIRISTSKTAFNNRAYVTWDDRAQKRVFMSISDDLGVTWNESQQIKGPQDTGGIDTPYNLTVSAYEEKVMLLWQAGEPGSAKCTIYSQWSEDDGKTWGDTTAVLGGRSDCPISTNIFEHNENYVTAYFVGEVNPTLVAWDGKKWSEPQSQTQLPSFSNPLTFDAILLGCRFDLIQDNQLYVLGCDQGRGGDVWFLSRRLEPVEAWFSSSSIWGDAKALPIKSEKPEQVTYFSSTADKDGKVHAVWVQSPVGDESINNITIQYSRWDGRTWSNPESVITSFNGVPVQLSVYADSKDRLLLTWIDDSNGDLLYSWANLERANLSSEWEKVVGIPSSSQLINSPDIVVDGSGRMVVAYVISINEERGVYVIQSIDNGSSWSLPVKVFDAVAANWDGVKQPKLSIGSDGVLHLFFIRSTFRVGQPVGLYYSRSQDGGSTWSDAQIISDGDINWADVSSYDGVVHVVWQEYDGLVVANLSQTSQDSGLTWGQQENVTGVNDGPTLVDLVSNNNGELHFIQIVEKTDSQIINQEDVVLEDWRWDGSEWNLALTKDIAIKGENVNYSLSATISSTGLLDIFVPVERTMNKKIQSEVLAFTRYLENAQAGTDIPVIPTPLLDSNETGLFPLDITPTPDYSVLYDDNVSTSPFQRNIAGIVLIGAGVLVTVYLLVWRRPSKNAK